MHAWSGCIATSGHESDHHTGVTIFSCMIITCSADIGEKSATVIIIEKRETISLSKALIKTIAVIFYLFGQVVALHGSLSLNCLCLAHLGQVSI